MLRMALLFSKTFGTFTDLLKHHFKLLQLFCGDILEGTFNENGVSAKEGEEQFPVVRKNLLRSS